LINTAKLNGVDLETYLDSGVEYDR